MPAAASKRSKQEAGSRLVHVADSEPGLRRRRAGTGFRYLDARGRTVRDAGTLQRIAALAIPPAWRDVWICRHANGHLQATGRDARGRKQYRYHPQWARLRARDRSERIEAFGKALPRLRRHLRRDLKLPGLPERKVAALVVAVLAETLVRVGNTGYARDNGSYGLTTLRDRHLRMRKGGARLRFRGKGGVMQDIELDDPRLAKLVRRCQQLPGQRLFQYRNDQGRLSAMESTQVNDYLHAAMGEAFSAKDFRSWGATLAAIRCLAELPAPGDDAGERVLASARSQVETEVAGRLGNTPAICRKSYIDPRVHAAWRSGWLAKARHGVRGARQWEALALRLLRRHRGATTG